MTSGHALPQCSLILTSDVSSLSTNRLRSIRKYQTPVVGVDYISSCLERGALLPVDGFRLDASLTPAPATKGRLRILRLAGSLGECGLESDKGCICARCLSFEFQVTHTAGLSDRFQSAALILTPACVCFSVQSGAG